MLRSLDRRRFLGAVGLASLAGCTGIGQQVTDGEPADDASPGASTGTAPEPTGPPTAADPLPLPRPAATIGESAVSGGPPKDGIPAIDRPVFVDAAEADGVLAPDDVVFGLAMGDAVKAYPQSVLVWHEICNDTVDGTPVSVTYCPLTGTAMGFLRGGTTFGVSGMLVNNNLIMYDRATETWWPQVLSTAVPGRWNEEPAIRSLRGFRLVWTTWERWRRAHPETAVLSRKTGHARNYDQDPYGSYNPIGGYYSPESDRTLFRTSSEDDRLARKRVVVGTRTPEGAAAFLKDGLRERRLLSSELAGQPILAVYDPSLDTGYLYRNPSRTTFEPRDGQFVDPDGGSHTADDLPLEPLLALDAMWFAWSGFYPDTSLVR